jgi:hypothetical protein
MSLFDDLLTKPVKSNPAASAGWSEQQDSIIVTDSPIIISESSPIATSVEVREPIITTPEPTATEDLSHSSIIIQDDTEETPTEPTEVVESKIDIEPAVNTISFMEDEKTEDTPVEKTERIDEVSFFGMNLGEDIPEETPKSIEKIEDTPKSFKEYIQSAITNATTLLQNLWKKDAETLEKEHEYEEQKKHFDELAKEEEVMHQKILAEKDQAEKMLAYLESEKNKAEGKTEETKNKEENEEINVMEEAIVEKVAEQKPKESKKKAAAPANDDIFDLSA